MTTVLIQTGCVLIYGIAGVCVYLMLLNRRIMPLVDSRIKVPIILASMVVLAGGAVAAGFFLAPFPWLLIPAGIVCLVIAGEARRAVIRRKCAGSAPVDTTPHAVDLASPVTTTDFVCHRFRVELPGWDGPPFRIAHLTDLHVNRKLPADYYRRVIDEAERAAPDMALYTGDFIDRPDSISILREVLRPVGKHGCFAVLGNHDYWTDPEGVRTVVREKGITMLTNRSVTAEIGGQAILVSGCEYPWDEAGECFTGKGEGKIHIVLSHTPDNIYRLAGPSADLVFSGHYHAGQIRLPLAGAIIIPSEFGRRFDHGHFVVNGTHLFVASGVGTTSPPFRIYCQPDIFVVDISGG